MTTTPSTPTPCQSLEEPPLWFFAEFERQVYDDAGSSCLDIFPHGLLSFVVSTPTWNIFPDNNIIVDGVPTIQQQHSLIRRGNGFPIPGIPKTTEIRPNEMPIPAVEVLYKAIATQRIIWMLARQVSELRVGTLISIMRAPVLVFSKTS